MASLFRFGRSDSTARRPRRASLIDTFGTMVASGEIDASDAEERFREILSRAHLVAPDH